MKNLILFGKHLKVIILKLLISLMQVIYYFIYLIELGDEGCNMIAE